MTLHSTLKKTKNQHFFFKGQLEKIKYQLRTLTNFEKKEKTYSSLMQLRTSSIPIQSGTVSGNQFQGFCLVILSIATNGY